MVRSYLFTADAGVGAGQKRPPRLSYSACSGPGGSRFANWANGPLSELCIKATLWSFLTAQCRESGGRRDLPATADGGPPESSPSGPRPP